MAYKGFISYSHAADNLYAPALQSALHKFAKPFNRLRAVQIFRDKSDLSANPALWSVIKNALDESEYFLLLASPDSAKSKWVKKELDYWLTIHHGKVDKLLVIMTDGELAWDSDVGDFDWQNTTALPRLLNWEDSNPVPNSLADKFTEEPFYLDHRWVKTEKDLSLRNPRFLDEIATLAATLHGRPKSEMIGDDVKAHTRYRRIRTAVIFILAVFAILAGGFGLYANQQQSKAEAASQLAEERRLTAVEEQRKAEEQRSIAEQQTKIAEDQRNIAQTETKRAQKATEDQKKAQGVAEERRREAEKQTKIADQRRKDAELAAENERIAKQNAENELTRSQHLLYAKDTKYASDFYAKGDVKTYRSILNKIKDPDSAGYRPGKEDFDPDFFSDLSTRNAVKKVAPGFEWNFLNHLTESSILFDEKKTFSPSHLICSSRGTFLASTGAYGAETFLVIWNPRTGKIISSFKSDVYYLDKIAFSPDEKWLVGLSHADKLRIWKTEDWQELKIEPPDRKIGTAPGEEPREESYTYFRFTPESDLLTASPSSSRKNRVLRRWNLESKTMISTSSINFDKNFQLVEISSDARHAIIQYPKSEKINRLCLLGIEKEQDGDCDDGVLAEGPDYKSVVFSEDGKQFAVIREERLDTNSYISESESKAILNVSIWDAVNHKKIHDLKEIVTGLQRETVGFSPDNKLFAASTYRSLYIWNLEDDKKKVIPIEEDDHSMAFSSDSKRIAIVCNWMPCYDGIRLIDVESEKDVFDFANEKFLAISSDKSKILTFNKGHSLSLWDVAIGESSRKEITSLGNTVAEFSPDGSYIYVKEWESDESASFRVFDSTNFEQIFLEDDEKCVTHRFEGEGFFSPKSDMLAQTCYLGEQELIEVWNIRTGSKLLDFKRENRPARERVSTRFTHDGTRLVVFNNWQSATYLAVFKKGKDGRFEESTETYNSGEHQGFVAPNERIIDFSSDGDWLITYQKGKISLKNIMSGVEKRNLFPVKTELDDVFHHIISIDSLKLLVVTDTDNVLHSMNLKTDKIVTLSGEARLSDMRLSPSRKYLIGIGEYSPTVNIWNIDNGKKISIDVAAKDRGNICYFLSADEERLIVGYEDGTVTLWDLIGGQQVLTFDAGQKDLIQVILSDDNKRLITVDLNESVKLWNTEVRR